MPRQWPRDFLRKLGNRIRARRKASGQLLKVTARAVGISPTQWTRYEIGEGHPPAYTLHRIAAVLGTSSSALMAEDNHGNHEQVDAMMAVFSDPVVGSIIRYLTAMPLEQRKSVQMVAGALAARTQTEVETVEVMQ